MWKFKVGGGVIVGIADSLGQLTGQNIAYIYPNFKTALLGNFTNGVMKSARGTSLTSFEEDLLTGFPRIVFDEANPDTKNDMYKFDESTKTQISSSPLLPDPYENEMVFVAPSTIQGAGLGLFSKYELDLFWT